MPMLQLGHGTGWRSSRPRIHVLLRERSPLAGASRGGLFDCALEQSMTSPHVSPLFAARAAAPTVARW